ncbi:period circadian protein isoform X2 [Leptidea sinapis]|uniref:period circadian protein isoform X2 n=1 Tax=Leptidea sinapis TaxID=189913 RepID=UPI0021C2E150|nr:period circadian protein isoform X2 [Leptidea sinapis]
MASNISEGASSNNNVNMDTLDDSEKNAKISDSAYSNSCTDSQARSNSSHSTHCGSHSSGSSGYGGEPTKSGYSQPPEKKRKINKKKTAECEKLKSKKKDPSPPKFEIEVTLKEQEANGAIEASKTQMSEFGSNVENVDSSTEPEPPNCANAINDNKKSSSNIPSSPSMDSIPFNAECFSCVMSMQDGVVMHTTPGITSTLGYPKDFWVGRPFIEFLHQWDRKTFESELNDLVAENVNSTKKKGNGDMTTTVVCRLRCYKALSAGFEIRETIATFTPFLLKLSFRKICDEEGEVWYLLVQATPFISAFKAPNEVVTKAVAFVLRHSSTGEIKYIDTESVPYLGYSPQDIVNKDAIAMYHPYDLEYLLHVYETIMKVGSAPRSSPYRMMTQNGDYVKLETEWSSFFNPWSRKLEFIIGKHLILEGPTNPDVFQSPNPEVQNQFPEDDDNKAKSLRENIIKILNEPTTKSEDLAKQEIAIRCQKVASIIESLNEKAPNVDKEIWIDIQEPENVNYDRDSVLLGSISPHTDSIVSKASTETQVNYNQLNTDENLDRYFNRWLEHCVEEEIAEAEPNNGEANLENSNEANGELASVEEQSEASKMADFFKSSVTLIPNNHGHADYKPTRLSENILEKHDSIMEMDLVKKHREIPKENRKKYSKEVRLKQKEHLARCNATFTPATAGLLADLQSNGLKRTSKFCEESDGVNYLYSIAKQPRRDGTGTSSPRLYVNLPNSDVTTSVPPNKENSANQFSFEVGFPQQMSPLGPNVATQVPFLSPGPYFNGTHAHLYEEMQQEKNHPSTSKQPLPLPTDNYQEACKLIIPPKTSKSISSSEWRKKRTKLQTRANNINESSGDSISSANVSNLSTNAVTLSQNNEKDPIANSGTNADKTDDESWFSSFSSHIYKSETGSPEESEMKKKSTISSLQTNRQTINKVAMKKIDPPWLDDVCLTPEIIYKYQVKTRSLAEVLAEDKKKLEALEQPSLVNEQLSQLYYELKLEGLPEKLTLEEGITSSSSSGDDTTSNTEDRRRKREHGKLVIIYEEDAPLPSPTEHVRNEDDN